MRSLEQRNEILRPSWKEINTLFNILELENTGVKVTLGSITKVSSHNAISTTQGLVNYLWQKGYLIHKPRKRGWIVNRKKVAEYVNIERQNLGYLTDLLARHTKGEDVQSNQTHEFKIDQSIGECIKCGELNQLLNRGYCTDCIRPKLERRGDE